MRKSANPEMLVVARDARDLTQAQLSESTGIQQPLLSMYETGRRETTAAHLTAIASATEFTEEFFCIDTRVHGFATPCQAFHRKRNAATARELRRIQAWANITRLQVDRLERSTPIESDEHLPDYSREDEEVSAEQAARLLRAAWSLPLGPIRNLIEVVERAGIIVRRTEFGTTRVDAVSHVAPGFRPLILLNAAIPTDRMRHSVAHELGHLVQHRGAPPPDAEEQADRFAGEFLMPEREIKPHLKGVTLERLAHLKPIWRSSMQALAVRAHHLGAITKPQYSSLFRLMGRMGIRRNEPEALSPEEPQLVHALLQRHRRDLGLEDPALADVLLMGEREMRSRFLTGTGGPRIVW